MNNNNTKQKVQNNCTKYLLLVVIIILSAAAVRLSAIGVSGLWLDEIYGASYINLNPLKLIVAVLRFDVQPPLYYLQLKLWGIPSHSDAWLLLNSITWSLGTIVACTYGAYRISGIKAALLAAAFSAFLGSEIYYSSEVRMYSMLSCLAIIGWIRSEIWLQKPSNKNTFWLVTITAMLAATHSAAVVDISSILLYIVISLVLRDGPKSALITWRIIVPTGIFLLPWLINASLRSVGQTTYPSVNAVVDTLSGWILGYGAIVYPEALRLILVGIIAISAILGLVYGDRRTKLILISFVIWPILFASAISFIIRPIWIPRLFAFCAPFYSLFLTFMLTKSLFSFNYSHTKRRLTTTVITLTCVLLMILGLLQNRTPWKMQYRSAARYIAANNAHKLPIYIPNNKTFWGIARYLDGPNWGSILKIQDPKRPDHSVIWRKIYHQLGYKWLQILGLVPQTRHLDTPNGTMWIGYSPLPKSLAKRGMWLVGNNSLLENVNNCPMYQQMYIKRYRGVVIVRCSGQDSKYVTSTHGS